MVALIKKEITISASIAYQCWVVVIHAMGRKERVGLFLASKCSSCLRNYSLESGVRSSKRMHSMKQWLVSPGLYIEESRKATYMDVDFDHIRFPLPSEWPYPVMSTCFMQMTLTPVSQFRRCNTHQDTVWRCCFQKPIDAWLKMILLLKMTSASNDRGCCGGRQKLH